MKHPKYLKSAATLHIKNAADMSPSGKRRVAAWLERQLKFFRQNSKHMSQNYRARYLYGE